MINYIEKGIWMHEYIASQGYRFGDRGTHWEATFANTGADAETEVQIIIDAFDPLPYAIADKRAELKREVATRTMAIYAFMEYDENKADPSDAIAFYDFANDIYTSMKQNARGPLADRLQSFKDVVDIGKLTNIQLNAQSDWEVVMAYDVTNTPAWP
jgi:hypothetical protein